MKFHSIHVLLTYQCNYECDHCLAWGSPWQTGVFTLAQLENVYQQALALGTVNEFYFESVIDGEENMFCSLRAPLFPKRGVQCT